MECSGHTVPRHPFLLTKAKWLSLHQSPLIQSLLKETESRAIHTQPTIDPSLSSNLTEQLQGEAAAVDPPSLRNNNTTTNCLHWQVQSSPFAPNYKELWLLNNQSGDLLAAAPPKTTCRWLQCPPLMPALVESSELTSQNFYTAISSICLGPQSKTL